jgi:hypothetical protein
MKGFGMHTRNRPFRDEKTVRERQIPPMVIYATNDRHRNSKYSNVMA